MTSPLLAPLLQSFFVEHLLLHKGVSPQTVASYRDTFRLLLRFLQDTTSVEPSALELNALDAQTLLSFLSHLEQQRNNSVRSRNVRLSALRSFFRFVALKEPACLGLATRVLAIPVKRAPRAMVGFLTREEVDAVLAAPNRSTWAGRRDQALLLVLYNTGARVSEIAAVSRSDVHLGATSAVTLHGKGRKERAVPLWRRTARLLQQWLVELGFTESVWLFPNAQGGRLTRHGIAYLLNQAVEVAQATCKSLAAKRVSPHVLRHTTAMHLLQSGVDPAVIALWLGHESLQTTHGYVEADLAMKQQAIEKISPPGLPSQRFKPSDALLTFLGSL